MGPAAALVPGSQLGGVQQWAGAAASHFSAMAQSVGRKLYDSDISKDTQREPSEAFQKEFKGVRSEAGEGAWERRELVYTSKKGQRVYRFAANPNGSLRERTWFRREAGVVPVVYVSESAKNKVDGYAITVQGERVGHHGNAIYIHNLRGDGGGGTVLDGIVFESDNSNRPVVAFPVDGTLMFYQRHGLELDTWKLIHRPGSKNTKQVKLERPLIEVWQPQRDSWISDFVLLSTIGDFPQYYSGDIKQWFTDKLRGQVGENVKARVFDKKNAEKAWTGTLEQFRDQFFSSPGES